MSGTKSRNKGLGGEREERFWAKVDKSGDCWEWLAYKNKKGYGQFDNGKGTRGAHRASWELTFGEIPDGLWVLHKCDNPGCVNPAHLFLGTATDNNLDRDKKGRQSKGEARRRIMKQVSAKGENAGNARLKTSDVIKIRELNKKGHTHDELAEMFNISPSYVSNICLGKKWAHIKMGVVKPKRNYKGEANGHTKLTSFDVITIRELRDNGFSLKDIAGLYNINPVYVCRITKGRVWTHLL